MTFDLLSMAVLSISAFIVITTMANTLGSDRRQRIAAGVMLGLWFVGVCALGASRSIVGGGKFPNRRIGRFSTAAPRCPIPRYVPIQAAA